MAYLSKKVNRCACFTGVPIAKAAIKDVRAVGPNTKSYFSWHHPGDEMTFYCYCAEMK